MLLIPYFPLGFGFGYRMNYQSKISQGIHPLLPSSVMFPHPVAFYFEMELFKHIGHRNQLLGPFFLMTTHPHYPGDILTKKGTTNSHQTATAVPFIHLPPLFYPRYLRTTSTSDSIANVSPFTNFWCMQKHILYENV